MEKQTSIQMDVEIGNKLIAEFMGGAYKVSAVTLEEDFDRIYFNLDEGNEVMYQIKPRYERHALKYNTSWDWLMPVMIKIGTMWHWQIEKFGCEIKVPKTEIGYGFVGGDSNDEDKLKHAVWLSVVEFIKWEQLNEKQ